MNQTHRSINEGVYALLLTPFQQSGEIDYTTYETYVGSYRRSHMLYSPLAERARLLFPYTRERLELTRLCYRARRSNSRRCNCQR